MHQWEHVRVLDTRRAPMRSRHSSLATKRRLPGLAIASCALRTRASPVLRSISGSESGSAAGPPPNTPAAVSSVRISGDTTTNWAYHHEETSFKPAPAC